MKKNYLHYDISKICYILAVEFLERNCYGKNTNKS